MLLPVREVLGTGSAAAQSQVNAVLTCKVCEEAFGSLKELSNHMIKANHFKDAASAKDSSGRSTPTSVPIPASSGGRNSSRSSPGTGGGGGVNSTNTSATATSAASASASSSDRRKKSLPVRKLLELERGELKKEEGGGAEDGGDDSSTKSPKSTQVIECDDCHEKIEPRCFLQHIKQCRAARAAAKGLNNGSGEDGGVKIKSDEDDGEGGDDGEDENKNEIGDEEEDEDEEADGGKCQANGAAVGDGSESTSSSSTKSSTRKGSPTKKGSLSSPSKKESKGEAAKEQSEQAGGTEEKKTTSENSTTENSGSGSVLSALEKLIEKNFDSKSRRTQQTGILQRLGIDEEVFPPWQNMAPSPLGSAGSAMSPSITWSTISAGLNGQSFADHHHHHHHHQQQQQLFSRSNSSSSSSNGRGGGHHHGGGGGLSNHHQQQQPQLRYRRNSSLKGMDKSGAGFLTVRRPRRREEEDELMEDDERGPLAEDESCEDEQSNNGSECGAALSRSHGKKNQNQNRRSPKRPLFSGAEVAGNKQSRGITGGGLNFPISSLLSSPPPSSTAPARPTSASSTASSSISPPSDQGALVDHASRMTPSSHRSDEDIEGAGGKRSKLLNGAASPSSEADGQGGQRPQAHNPLFQLQKLLDKTEHTSSSPSSRSHHSKSGRRSAANVITFSPPRTPTPRLLEKSSSSITTCPPPLPLPRPYLTLKCAFCETQIASRAAYRAHLAKVHLALGGGGRDSVAGQFDLSAISDEELLLLVLAKNSNLPLGMAAMGGSLGGLLMPAAAAAPPPPPPMTKSRGGGHKESKRKSSKAAAAAAVAENHHHHLASWNHNSSPSAGSAGGATGGVPSPQETSQSKFLKYAELAKQLSSKYV
ncbi:Teashirt 3 [Tyrophagus putrescentiae]|nr:Teashirt 3 [Tyrophagus putrescentiae]